MKFTAPISNRILPLVPPSKSLRYLKAQTWKLKSSLLSGTPSKRLMILQDDLNCSGGLLPPEYNARHSESAASEQKTMSEDLPALVRQTGAPLDRHFNLRS